MAVERPLPPEMIPDQEAAGLGLNPIALVLRRWPLLLVGLAVGALCGALIHLTSTPAYQSTAQLLVIKKRNDVTYGSDSRSTQVEDYVATQLTLIKSEKIRRSAAKELRKMTTRNPLPNDDGVVAEMLKYGLNAAKDKDALSTGSIGSGIVILTFRGGDPNDTKTYLEAVIRAYQGELTGVYDRATEDRLQNLNALLESKVKERATRITDKFKFREKLGRVTNEELAGVRIRLGVMRGDLNKFSSELVQVERTLVQISKATINRRDRIALYAQLTGQSRSASFFGEAGGPEQSLRILEAQYSAQGEKLGKDHPQMKEMLAQIKFYKEEIARLNPANPEGIVDELSIYGAFMKEKDTTLRLQIKDLEKNIKKDDEKMLDAGTITSQIEQKELEIRSSDADILRLTADISSTDATRGAGGYSASDITPPNFGGKVAPVMVQSALFGMVIGLMLGGGAMAFAEYNDKSFKSPAEIRKRLGVPVIGHIPELRLDLPAESGTPSGMRASMAAALRPKSIEAEAYRGVRTQLYFSTQGRGHQVIQVTSPNPGDGKSTLAANLAITIAQSGKRVVLLDCDMRKPQVHKIFELEKDGKKLEFGLSDIISGNATIARALKRSPVPNLDLIPCGPRPKNPAELLTSPRLQQLMDDLKSQYDFVIVDTPPVLAVSDPANVAPRVDGVIIVFKMTKNARPAAERTNEQLLALGANVLGVVVNGSAGSISTSYNGYNYGSRYGYRYTDYTYAYNYGLENDADDDDNDGGVDEKAKPRKAGK